MPKTKKRAYSRYTREALELLAVMIRETRLERKVPAKEVAERAGISRGLLQRIEKGDSNCAIGVVFEVAYLLGIRLFDHNAEGSLSTTLVKTKEKLALLPKAARRSAREVDDDF